MVRRGTLCMMLTAAIAALPGWAAAQDLDLEGARRRFPPLSLGGSVRQVDGAAPVARSCPAAGARVEQRGGPAIEYDGADPANPDLCRMRFDGQPAEGWFGIWLTIWPGAEDARVAFGRLLRGRVGDTEAFVVRMSPELTFYDILRHDGIEDLRLLGRIHRTIKLSHYREGAPPNIYRSVVTGWKDLDTGILVYVTYQHISGAPELATPLNPTAIVGAP